MDHLSVSTKKKDSDPIYRRFLIGELTRGALAVVAGVLLGIGLTAAGESGLSAIGGVVGAGTVYGFLHLI